MFSKTNIWRIATFAVYTLVVCFLLWPIITNLSTQLYDWNDYPLLVWVIDQHITHILQGEWGQFFQSNIFYPFQDTMLFTDLLLSQAVIALLVYLVVPNTIFAFNITFVVTFFLNFAASWVLWRKRWQGPLLALAVVGTSLSPFVLINLDHFQLISLWPFLLGLSQLINNKGKKWQPVWLGIWTSITFISSVYLAIFLIYCTGVWLVIQIISERKHLSQQWKHWASWIALFSITVSILAGPFMVKYYQVRQSYDAKRSYEEYVNYSASVFDYVSTKPNQSFVSNISVVKRWNALLATSAGGGYFPTVILSVLMCCSFVLIRRKKPSQIGIGMPFTKESMFFLCLLVSGFLFSLGPRVRVSSIYVGPPLPYEILLKLVPLFEPIRVTARWALLFFIGVLFFALLGLEKILKKVPQKWHFVVVAFVLAIYFAEVLPLGRVYEPATAARLPSNHMATLCEEKQVLLEYPIEYSPTGSAEDIFVKLQHWTKIVLDATEHSCNVVNGYSGFTPKDYNRYHHELDAAVEQQQLEKITELLREREVELLRLHTDKLTATQSATFALLEEELQAEKLFNSDTEQIFLITNLKQDS